MISSLYEAFDDDKMLNERMKLLNIHNTFTIVANVLVVFTLYIKGALTPSLVYCSNEETIVSERLDVIYQCYNNDDLTPRRFAKRPPTQGLIRRMSATR